MRVVTAAAVSSAAKTVCAILFFIEKPAIQAQSKRATRTRNVQLVCDRDQAGHILLHSVNSIRPTEVRRGRPYRIHYRHAYVLLLSHNIAVIAATLVDRFQ